MKRVTAVAVLLASAAIGGVANGEEGNALTVQVRFTNRGNASAPALYIAGEHVPVGVRITGLQTDGEGKLDLVSQAELLDGTGRTILPLPSERIQQGLPLGGGEVNYGRNLALPADAVGKHILRVSVKDQVSGKQGTDEVDIQVADASTFGLMNLRTALDPKAEVATDVFPVGRNLFVLFTANGCADRDGQVHVECEGILTDSTGRPLGRNPVRFTAKPEPSIYGSTGQANVGLYMNLNRSGKFLLKLKVKDAIHGQEAEQVIPILVVGLDPAQVERSATKPQDAKR